MAKNADAIRKEGRKDFDQSSLSLVSDPNFSFFCNVDRPRDRVKFPSRDDRHPHTGVIFFLKNLDDQLVFIYFYLALRDYFILRFCAGNTRFKSALRAEPRW